jgi:uncharacterized membrane protein
MTSPKSAENRAHDNKTLQFFETTTAAHAGGAQARHPEPHHFQVPHAQAHHAQAHAHAYHAQHPQVIPDLSQRTKHLQQTAGRHVHEGLQPLIKLSFKKLLLLFVVGSIVGIVVETLYHMIVFGEYESRAGLVWGPFSPLYGVGAVVITSVLNQFWHYPRPVIFVISAFIGSVLEFVTSWGMEVFFGAIAWDYSNTFLNIDGRVNFLFACMWGALGVVWVKVVLPFIKRIFDQVHWENQLLKILNVVLCVFFAINILVTVSAFDRQGERAEGRPATSPIDYFLDATFPSTWMENHFANMSIYGSTKR